MGIWTAQVKVELVDFIKSSYSFKKMVKVKGHEYILGF